MHMITYELGTQRWYINDKLHRLDGPAVIYEDGSQEWWVNDQLHRTDGPAIIFASGAQHWYLNGRCHRTDGPAVIFADGTQHWYFNSIHITDEINKWMDKLDITYPFDEEYQTLFSLTFGGK